MSFQDVSLTGPSAWVGLRNYELMFKDPAFEIVWTNMLEYTTWSLVLGFFVPVVIAILVREMRKGNSFFRVVYFLPTVVPAAVAVIIWRFIYDPDGGVANEFLKQIGIARQLWLQDPALAKPALIAVMTWAGFGTTTLIYLASLQDISTELYEAAELDGATPLQRVLRISLPHLYPIMSLMFILQIITVVQVFTEPFLLTNGGPGRETLTPAMNIYNRAFIRMDMGYASVWSVTMIVVLAVFSIIYRVANNRLNPDA
jgi:multiple sugar transport system permease protein